MAARLTAALRAGAGIFTILVCLLTSPACFAAGAPERVFPAGPPAAAFLYAIAPDKMLGWTHEPGGRDRGFIAAPYDALPHLGALTGGASEVAPDALARLKPDLILDVGTIASKYRELAERTQRETGIPYVLMDGSIAAMPETFRNLGHLLGVERRGETLAAEAETSLAGIRARIATLAPARAVSIYYGRGKDGLTTAGIGSIGGEFIEILGQRNVASDRNGMFKVMPRQIAAWDPDVIVVLGREAADALRRDPRTADLRAVREQRLYASPTLPFGWVDGPPSPSRLLGLAWLARCLFPDIFPDDIRARTRMFYKTFYQVEVDDARLDALLAG